MGSGAPRGPSSPVPNAFAVALPGAVATSRGGRGCCNCCNTSLRCNARFNGGRLAVRSSLVVLKRPRVRPALGTPLALSSGRGRSMTIGVPLLEGRVAPRCTSANRLLLVTLTRGGSATSRILDVQIEAAEELIELAQAYRISTLVCGGITRECRLVLELHRIAVIENVACSAGEVLRALECGMLRSGFGLHPAPVGGLVSGAGECSSELAELGRTIASLAGRRPHGVCRLAELIRFCAGMGFRRVGLAFCADLRQPALALARGLRGWIRIVPAACTVRPLVAGPGGREALTGGRQREPFGDPLSQARLLNAARTNLNVAFGLCVGAECLLSRASKAPITALFVQDVAAGNDPTKAHFSADELRRWLRAELRCGFPTPMRPEDRRADVRQLRPRAVSQRHRAVRRKGSSNAVAPAAAPGFCERSETGKLSS